jgi:major type 1 subunit fimbrin (pilin)
MRQMRTGILAVAAPAAFAADGTITINGQVTAQTCTISGNGGGKDFTVTLPTVSASALTTPGATAGRTPFNVALSKCTPNSGNVAVYFEPGATVDASTGRLVNTASSGAGNVQVGLLNSDNSEIRLGGALATQNSKPVALTGGAVTLGYFAQYVATGQATAGSVTTSTLYSIVYQ